MKTALSILAVALLAVTANAAPISSAQLKKARETVAEHNGTVQTLVETLSDQNHPDAPQAADLYTCGFNLDGNLTHLCLHLQTLESCETKTSVSFNAACDLVALSAKLAAEWCTKVSTTMKSPALVAETRELRKLCLAAQKLVLAAKR